MKKNCLIKLAIETSDKFVNFSKSIALEHLKVIKNHEEIVCDIISTPINKELKMWIDYFK